MAQLLLPSLCVAWVWRIIVVKEAPSLLKRAEVAMFAALMPATERAFAYTTSHSEWGSLLWFNFNVGYLSKEWF